MKTLVPVNLGQLEITNKLNNHNIKFQSELVFAKPYESICRTNNQMDELNVLTETNTLKNDDYDTSNTRKRKWISKYTSEMYPILSISTDSLRYIMSEAQPVPLGDIKLDSSSDVEEVQTKISKGDKQQIEHTGYIARSCGGRTFILDSPSPSKNEECSILYITNLVRPFTVLQLKGLLSRTGKIISDGFWMDRIKSKCYVQYETEDEAIETRHALHGIRWPASNPKFLHVEFGRKDDMQKAIMFAENDSQNRCYNESIENIEISCSKNDRKLRPPVREWDVGKHNLDGEKESDETKSKDRSKQKCRDINNLSAEKNHDKHMHKKILRSSVPLGQEHKKDNEPPLRLLDDLFRKTRTTPCIYWLPLTPEQIVEKDVIRIKRVYEQQQRMDQADVIRVKSYDFDKGRDREREKKQTFDEPSIRRKCSLNKRRY